MTQKKAPKKAPKKKYYKTKNDVIEELKSELEAAEFLHREQIAKMQIEHQEELDAARHKDEEVYSLTDDLFEKNEELDSQTVITRTEISQKSTN